jgi:hypothetical protein
MQKVSLLELNARQEYYQEEKLRLRPQIAPRTELHYLQTRKGGPEIEFTTRTHLFLGVQSNEVITVPRNNNPKHHSNVSVMHS